MYPYPELSAYLLKLKSNKTHNCRINWSYLCEHIESEPHTNEKPIHLADTIASALHKAIEPKEHGMVDDRSERNLLSLLYRSGGRAFGLKMFPPKEIQELRAAGHLGFLRDVPL
jgi:hypothetical protein